MEVVRWRRAVANLHVVFRAELEITFQPRRRVFGALAFIAMGQQHDETTHAQPLVLARTNELIDNHLRAIGEIAELGFPQNQHLRFR